jgi:hypothetical protein
MSRPDDDRDAARDAHLLAALRHAPDRDAAPPPEVSARILAAAREAVRPARTALPWSQRLAAWLRAPQTGAAFATLVVAALVGLMWSTREPPLPDRAEPDAAIAAPATPAAGPAESAPPTMPAPPPKVDTTSKRGPPEDGIVPDPPPRRSVESAGRNAPPAPGAQPPAALRRTAPTPESRADARQQSPAGAPEAAERSVAVATMPAPPAPGPATAPAAAPPPVGNAAAPAAPSVAGAAQERSRLMVERDASAQQRQAAGAAAPARPGELGLNLAKKAEGAAVDPLTRIDAVLSPPAVATWMPSSVAHGAAQRDWWAGVASATRGRWVRLPNPSVPVAPWLVLSVAGEARAMFWFTGDSLALQIDGEVWQAPVPEAQRRQWQEAAARW